MSPVRPDLVDCWIYRVPLTARNVANPEILLLRRAPDRYLPGLWQCVSGSLEAGERVPLGALRELAEETGFTGDAIDAFYDLDLVNQFYEPLVDAVVLSAVFAVRVGPHAEPVLSHEHDAARWLTVADAHAEVIWPAYRTAIERIRDDLSQPERAPWFTLTTEGIRPADGVASPRPGRAVDSAPGDGSP